MATLQRTTAQGGRRSRFLDDFGFRDMIANKSPELGRHLQRGSFWRLADAGMMDQQMASGLEQQAIGANAGYDSYGDFLRAEVPGYGFSQFEAMKTGALGGGVPTRPQMNQGLENPFMNLMRLFQQRRQMGL